MRIKHWAGYGTVSVKKIGDRHGIWMGTRFRIITIDVTGLHEQGLERRDLYDVHNWIGKRYTKDHTYADLRYVEYRESINGAEAVYTLWYKED